MTPEFKALMPQGEHEYLVPAWLGCFSWALRNCRVMEDFTAATGVKYTPPRTGIEAMIDDATGADDAFFCAFAKWMNENIWGDMDAPESEES